MNNFKALNLLETGCLIARLAPYATHPTTDLVKSRKLYWSDCGLAASEWNLGSMAVRAWFSAAGPG